MKRSRSRKWHVFVRRTSNGTRDTWQLNLLKDFQSKRKIRNLNVHKYYSYLKLSCENKNFSQFLPLVGSGDQVIVASIDLLGNDVFAVTDVMYEIWRRDITLHIADQDTTLDKIINIEEAQKTIKTLRSISSAIISRRSREGSDNRRAKFYPLGRPKGSAGPRKLDAKFSWIYSGRQAGYSITKLAQDCGVCWKTMRDFCTKHEI